MLLICQLWIHLDAQQPSPMWRYRAFARVFKTFVVRRVKGSVLMQVVGTCVHVHCCSAIEPACLCHRSSTESSQSVLRRRRKCIQQYCTTVLRNQPLLSSRSTDSVGLLPLPSPSLALLGSRCSSAVVQQLRSEQSERLVLAGSPLLPASPEPRRVGRIHEGDQVGPPSLRG